MKFTIKLVLHILLATSSYGDENAPTIEEYGKPCIFSETINITEGIKDGKNIIFDGSTYGPEIYSTYDYIITVDDVKEDTDTHIRGCICKLKKNCIRFCGKKKNEN